MGKGAIQSDYEIDDSSPTNLMGIEMTTDLNGHLTGNIKTNIENGFIFEGEMTQILTGNMKTNMSSPDGSEIGSLKILIDSNTVITYSTTKVA